MDNDSDKNADDFESEYRSDKKRNGWVSVFIGVLFIVWTIFDIATNFWEDSYWYMNIFYILLGGIFFISGVADVRKYSSKNSDRDEC